jgi:hypothetical protein
MSNETQHANFFQFIGEYSVIPASGGFNVEQQFGGPIKVYKQSESVDVDMTLALQLKINVRTFNEKLGIIKDLSNDVVISSPLDAPDGVFPMDISFSFQDFIPDIIVDNIISLGNFSHIYSDFRRNIVNFYSLNTYSNVFDSWSEEQQKDDLTKEVFVELFDKNGVYSNSITGIMSIYFVRPLLESMLAKDPFNNRTNKTINDGFIAGDIVLLTDGISIKLDLSLKEVPPLPEFADISVNTPVSLLGKVYEVPLLLYLENL